MALKSSQRIAIGFSTWAGAGDWRLFFLHRDRIEQVSLDDVRRVAIHYLKQSNRTSGLFRPTNAPDRTEVPETPNVLALVKRYKGREALSEGEAFEATPDNIESRVKRTTLSNGLKLALLSKETRGDSVRAVLTLHFGTEEAIQGRIDALDLIPAMLMRGTKKRTYEELRDELDRLKATVSFGGGGFFGRNYGSVSANIVTDRPHLAAVIRLVAEMLTEPSFPEKEFEIVKKERLTSMEEQLSNPQTRAVVSLLRRLNPWPSDNVRYVPTVLEGIERLKAVTLEQVRNCHRGFYGANNAEMTVVGDFDEQEITKVIEETLGKWNATKPFTRIATQYRSDIPGSEEVIHTPDKKMAMIGSAINMELRDDDPDYPAMHLANYVFGASAKSRLLNRLRQKEGISYGAGSVFRADSQDHNALFLAYGICAPQNADQAAMSTLDEFNLLVREGIPEVELTAAKDSYAKKSKNQLTNDRFVASFLNRSLHLGRTMEYRKWLASEVESLTPQKVQSVIKKHLNLDRLIRVKAGDLEPESDKQEAGETTGVD
ncbi:MAG: insulinase family protein [Planctomycetes bacterium]|nr:insulinase family protein [Planctomycetota bacterium]